MTAEGKVYESAVAALEDVFDGAVIMIGGFGVPGLPQSLVKALMELGASGVDDDFQHLLRAEAGRI